MADFGLITFATHYGMQPAELARWAEDSGFESLFFAEHTHIPTEEVAEYHGEFVDFEPLWSCPSRSRKEDPPC